MVNTESLLKKYYPENKKGYEILLNHSRQVRDYALDILKKHPELNSINRNFIDEAAMLHDIGIFMCNAPGISCYGTHDYIEHGYLGADLLRKEGLPAHALVCERHTGAGISFETIVENNYPLPHRDMLPVTVEEKLICYADKFFSKSKPNQILTVRRIREKLSKFGEEEVAKFDAMHELFKC